MAEGFDQPSSSFLTESRLCNRMFKEINAYFGDRLLDSIEKKQFYIRVSRTSLDTVRVWIYDDKKTFTRYGIQVTLLSDRLESSFVKLRDGVTDETDETDENVIRCGTKQNCQFYPYGDSRFHDTTYDFCMFVRNVSMKLLRNKLYQT